VDVRQFQLKVVNLPHQISYSFIDPTSQARLSQLNFPAGVTEQRLGLRLFLPERADEEVRIDQPLEFWALVMDEAQAQRSQAERVYTASEIEQSRAGRVRLVVIPRGVGRIEASAVSLFSEIQTGETVDTNITIRNTGTRRLDNIKLTTVMSKSCWGPIPTRSSRPLCSCASGPGLLHLLLPGRGSGPASRPATRRSYHHRGGTPVPASPPPAVFPAMGIASLSARCHSSSGLCSTGSMIQKCKHRGLFLSERMQGGRYELLR
jgi:hypothetical protein